MWEGEWTMAYNEQLTNRVRAALAETPKVTEKRMFSGVGFMVDEKLCVSVGDDRIMLRVDPRASRLACPQVRLQCHDHERA
jgi:TfoX/Sxy family transcriptional regulator of competence genes